MKENNQSLSFTTLIASSVHDMKNILGAVLESIDWLSRDLSGMKDNHKTELSKMTRLITHVNTELMELLCLYKFENEQYSLSLRDQEVMDFLELQVAFLSALIKESGLEFQLECDEELIWNFDEVLLATAIRNAGMNSLKFAKKKIMIVAEVVDDYLRVAVEDDGTGFPEGLLGRVEDRVGVVDLSSGSTGLGLHFGEVVSKMHKNKNKQGYIELSNNSRLGGASFAIYIP